METIPATFTGSMMSDRSWPCSVGPMLANIGPPPANLVLKTDYICDRKQTRTADFLLIEM